MEDDAGALADLDFAIEKAPANHPQITTWIEALPFPCLAVEALGVRVWALVQGFEIRTLKA